MEKQAFRSVYGMGDLKDKCVAETNSLLSCYIVIKLSCSLISK